MNEVEEIWERTPPPKSEGPQKVYVNYRPKKSYHKRKVRGMPYLILASLLYGRFGWWRRHPGGGLTIPTRRACDHFSLSPASLKDALFHLKEVGFLEELQAHGDWYYVRPAIPLDMMRELNYVQRAKIIDVSDGCPSEGLLILTDHGAETCETTP